LSTTPFGSLRAGLDAHERYRLSDVVEVAGGCGRRGEGLRADDVHELGEVLAEPVTGDDLILQLRLYVGVEVLVGPAGREPLDPSAIRVRGHERLADAGGLVAAHNAVG
jgi:hypothetical protein